MPKESEKSTITSFSGTPLVRVVDGLNSRNISPANLVAETGAQTALDGRYAPLQLIETKTPTSGTTVTFTGIPQTFYDLQLVGSFVGSGSAGGISIRFNGDTGSNYDYVQSRAITTMAAIESVGGTSIQVGVASSYAGASNSFEAWIPNYADANAEKACHGNFGQKSSEVSGGLRSYSWHGWWRDASAISSITVVSSAPAFAAGTRISLYGRR